MKTITLDYPVEFNGQQTTELTMRRAKVRDQLAIQGTENYAEQEVKLFANLCQIEPDIIAELDMSDYTKLQEAYTGFLE